MLSSVAVVVACALSGCDSPLPAPTELVGGKLALQSSEGVQQSATGSGHYTAGDEIRTFAFSATKRADGSVSGQYQINVHASDLFFHVAVTCMDVVGNTAWVAGIITKASGPPVVEGTVSYFYATDGGEGPDAVDIVSVARINDRPEAAEEFCTQHPRVLPPRVVEQGNVQVRSQD
jgi:hypothetical protein